MTVQFLENYDYYQAVDAQGTCDLMGLGFWSNVNRSFGAGCSIPAWETKGKAWFNVASNGGNAGRRSFPGGALAGIGVGCRLRYPTLPDSVNDSHLAILDGSNATIFILQVRPDGNLDVRNAAGAIVTSTTIPCIFPGTSHKIQFQAVFHATLGTVEVRVDNVAKIGGASAVNGSNLALSGLASQVNFFNDSGGGSRDFWIDFIAPYSLTGTYNSNWPSMAGIVTLWPVSAPIDTWTPRPYLRFGAGVLRVPALSDAAVDAGATANMDLGSGDYTLETQFRVSALPTTTNYSVLFGKWNATGGARSYRLVKYGPSVNGGETRFEITTDGSLGTLTNIVRTTFDWVIGTWYHVAISRTAGVTRFFVNGVQIGLNIADANTYFASTTNGKFAIGGEMSGITVNVLANTTANATFDETRITVGVGRYTANFAPPVAIFPRTVGGDPSFASVQLLIGCDANLVDESTTSPKTLAARGAGGAGRMVPLDGPSSWLVFNNPFPDNARFLEAAFLAATNTLQCTANPANTETVRIGATTYTFNTVLGAANSILIGATLIDSFTNLMDAVNGGPGIGVRYGTGTVPNASATAVLGPTASDFTAKALLAGTVGNAIISTETLANGSWLSGGTFANGANIPAATEFTINTLPPTATGLRALFMIDRAFVEADNATVRKSFVVGGIAGLGADNALTTSPTLRGDVIEQDPNTGAALTPVSVINGRIRYNRTS